MVIILFYVFIIPKEDEIAKVTENEIHAYRMMMQTDRIFARVSRIDGFVSNSEQHHLIDLALPNDISSTWQITQLKTSDVAISPGGSMWCSLDKIGGSMPLTEDYEGTIENSIKQGIRRLLPDTFFTVVRFGLEEISNGSKEKLFKSRTVVRWRGRHLYEYSYHRFNLTNNRAFYHYCVSPFFEDKKKEAMIRVLRGAEIKA